MNSFFRATADYSTGVRKPARSKSRNNGNPSLIQWPSAQIHFLPGFPMTQIKRWLPAILMMAIIFGFSSIPSKEMPSFGLWDFSVKKLGHACGYGLLAVAYQHGLGGKRPWLAWLMAIAYAATDEFHQSFVPGRNPSPVDVLLFDNLGALAGLWIYSLFTKKRK
jgi:VanZ family protein